MTTTVGHDELASQTVFLDQQMPEARGEGRVGHRVWGIPGPQARHPAYEESELDRSLAIKVRQIANVSGGTS